MRTLVMMGLLVSASLACATRDEQSTRQAESAATSLAPASPPVDTIPRELAAGTVIEASIQQPISSAEQHAGDSVRAVVRLNVTDALGRVIVPGGSDVMLEVARIARATDSRSADGAVSLRLRSLSIGANRYTPRADVGAVPHTQDAAARPPADRDALVAAGTPITIRLVQPLKITTN